MLIVLSSLARAQGDDRINVFVSILPQKYFVERIGGDMVKVSVLVPPGASPHIYEPKPRQMEALKKTRAFFAVGINLEDVWLKKIQALHPDIVIIRTDENVKKIPVSTHKHEEIEGRHDNEEHGSPDPHIWLSPPLVRIQAETIMNGLILIDPAHGELYTENFRKFIKEIDDLDSRFRTIFRDREGMEFMVFHPSWGYFADTYGLKQISIEMDGKEPKPSRIKELIEHARNRGIKVVFVQPQISPKTAEIIAKEINGSVLVADPLAEDWLLNLETQAEKFWKALK
ncbi:MAG: zinc ABC transporter substrate-binding protein [Deltaproteobacteria bacterium]|nr:zinc ABC transporter substrate-binding protein [Deltaproteobacteria bacterium]